MVDILSQSIIDINNKTSSSTANEYVDIFALKYDAEENMVLKDPFINMKKSISTLVTVDEGEEAAEVEEKETNDEENNKEEPLASVAPTDTPNVNKSVVETLPTFCARQNTKLFNVPQQPQPILAPTIQPIRQAGYQLQSRTEQQLAEVTKLASEALSRHPLVVLNDLNDVNGLNNVNDVNDLNNANDLNNVNNVNDVNDLNNVERNNNEDDDLETRVMEKLGDFESNRRVLEEITERVKINDILKNDDNANVRDSVRRHFNEFFNNKKQDTVSDTGHKKVTNNSTSGKEQVKRIVQQGISGDPLNNIVESFLDNFIPLTGMDAKQQNIYMIITTITTNVYSAIFSSFNLKPDAKDLEIMTRITTTLFYEMVGEKVDTMLNASNDTAKRSVRIYLLSLMLIPYSVKIYTSAKRKTVQSRPQPISYPPIPQQPSNRQYPFNVPLPNIPVSRKNIYNNTNFGGSGESRNNTAVAMDYISVKRPANVVYDFGSGPLFMNNTNIKRARLG